MIPPDLQRVFEIFREVAELDAGSRASALDRCCGQDAALRSEVEAMLREDSREEVPLDRPVGVPLVAWAEDIERAPEPQRPVRVGAYRVQGVIDVGGMGTVYAATQDHPSRRVALKTIRAGFAGEALLKRFRLEAEVLGSLRHPGIAQVYESGVHVDGPHRFPFIAMEFVAGARNLVRYAREEGLELRQRIELFLEVCEAVQHGHQRGVIHRDLKPGNLLVDEAGAVKVIDFGVARVLDPEAYALSLAETGSGQLIGTLQYMSPEQLGEVEPTPDIRSDIYSLGIVLFELLAERFPYGIEGLALPGIVRVIAENEPQRLAQVRPELSGDLDWIVGRAIEKERDRRYPSVSELAADLRRHLRNEPVSVGPPSGWYRLGKFALRHRFKVAAASVLAIALIGGTAGTLWQNARARANLVERNVQLEISSEAYGFLQRVFRSVRPEVARGEEVTAREVLDQARQELASVPPDHPRVEAEVRRNLGETYSALGEFELAAEELERSLELHRAEYGADDQRTLETEVSLLFDRLELGANRAVEARAAELLMAFTADPDRDPSLVVRAGLARGSALRTLSRFAEADEALRAAVELAEDVLGVDDELAWAGRQQRAGVLAEAGRSEEAAELKQDIVEHRIRLRGELDPLALSDGLELANILAAAGRVREAEELWDELLPKLERVLNREHPRCLYHRAYRGWTLVRAGGPERGVVHLDVALDGFREARGNEVVEHIDGMIMAGEGMTLLGRLDEAVELFHAGLEAQERLSPTPTRATFDLMMGLGSAQMRGGEAEEAEALYVAAERGAAELLGDHWVTNQIRGNLGGLYFSQGRYREARRLIEGVIAFYLGTAGPDDPLLTLLARSNYAVLLREMGELELSEEVLNDVLRRRERVLPADHADILLTRQELAVLAGRAGRTDEAARGLREAIASREPGHQRAVQAGYLLAGFLREAGDLDAADIELQRISAHVLTWPPSMTIGPRVERVELELDRGDVERAELEIESLARIVAPLPQDHFGHPLMERLRGRAALQGDPTSPRGIEYLERARAGFHEALGPRSWRTQQTGLLLLGAYDGAGRVEEAAALRQELLEVE